MLLKSIPADCMNLFGWSLTDAPALIEMLIRFLLNTLMVGIVVHFLYYPKGRRRDYYFTYIMLTVSIFMLIYLMDDTKMKIGAALGLFAIFGIIRYRTEQVPIREMTYLFFLVALSVVNALAVKLSVVSLLVANGLFLITAWVAEKNRFVSHISCKYIKYDNIRLIVPEKIEELKADLEKRTGLKIVRVEVGSIDFLRDSALLKMYYLDPTKEKVNSVDTMMQMPKEYE